MVAGSRGAKIAVSLIHNNIWKGPTLIISGMMPPGVGTFPEGVPIMLIHGIHDRTVPIGLVRLSASTGRVKLIELETDHSMNLLLENNTLSRYISELVEFAKSSTTTSTTSTTSTSTSDKNPAVARASMMAAIAARKQ
eukprot:TRINITY_DN2085_c1_g1_i3.p1 TRINITY_DN2085_c1_g1~~TRINITY_DN2085_c1_g1_i3.p1  ORF type:complete len:138 (-),score=35.46 TRINITY_DN2085_c1_g1_i3:93-506(-)